MRKLTLMLAFLLALTVMPVFAQSEADVTILDRIIDSTEQETPDFTVLLAALEVADPTFMDILDDEETTVTLFTPTDFAFETYLAQAELSAEELLADTDTLNMVLAYHVLGIDFYGEDIGSYNNAFIGTLLTNGAIRVSTQEDVPYVNQAQVLQTNLGAINGVIHVIDAVLIPPPLEQIDTETEADDLISIADYVAQTAEDGDDFTILLQAIQAADPLILELLSGELGYNFTVFAPTDAAFEAAFETLGLSAEEVLADPTLLTLLLAYHVVIGELDNTGLGFYGEQMAMGPDTEEEADATLPRFATLFPAGTLEFDALSATINGALIVDADIAASNGVIHVIDAVLVPDFASIGYTLPSPDDGA